MHKESLLSAPKSADSWLFSMGLSSISDFIANCNKVELNTNRGNGKCFKSAYSLTFYDFVSFL